MHIRPQHQPRWPLWTMCGIVAAVLTACAAPGAPAVQTSTAAQQAPEPFKIILATTPQGQDAPLFYGKSEGIFKAHGVDLDIQPGTGSQVAYDTVASGRADAGATVYSAVVLSGAKGGNLVAFASQQQVDGSGILVSESSNIKSIADLRGTTLLSSAGSATRQILPVLLFHAGIPADQVTVKDVQLSAMYATYAAGQADGMITVIPNSLPLVSKSRPSRQLRFIDNGIVQPGGSLVAKPDVLRDKHDLFVRVVAALAESESAALAHPAEAAAAVTAAAPQLASDVAMGGYEAAKPFNCWDQTPPGSLMVFQPDALWRQGVGVFEEAQMIPTGSVQIEKFYTNDIVQAAASLSPGKGATCP